MNENSVSSKIKLFMIKFLRIREERLILAFCSEYRYWLFDFFENFKSIYRMRILILVSTNPLFKPHQDLYRILK